MPALERLEDKRLLSAITLGDDSFQMQQGSQGTTQVVQWDVLGNDSSAAGGLVITSVASNGAGSAWVTSGDPDDPLSHDTLSFELDPAFVGSDSITYTVSDADGDQATGTVWVTVTGSGDGGPLTLAEQLQQLTLQAAKAQADLAAGQTKFDGAISGAQSKLKQQQAADEKKHADALAAAQKKLDDKVSAGHDKAIDALKAADTAYQQALTERLDSAATAIATGQDTLVSKATAADHLYQAQHQAAVDAATSALDSATATLAAAHEAAQAAAADQMTAAETGWNTAVTDASTVFETTYQATEAALTAAADQAVTLFGTATEGVASSFSTALTTAVSQRDALLAGLSGASYVTTFSDPVFTAAMAAADTALNDAITAARANLQSQSTTAMNGYNTATQTAAHDLTTGDEHATTQLGTDLHNADVAEQTAIHNVQTDYDAAAALAETAYDHSVHGAHDDLVAAVTADEGALKTSVNLAESQFETDAKEALAKYTAWVAEAFGSPGSSTPTTTGTTTTGTTTTGSAMTGSTTGTSMTGSMMPATTTTATTTTPMMMSGTTMTGTSMTGGSMGGSSTGMTTGTATATLGTFQIAVKADAQTAYDALQLAANAERDACVAADTAYITAINADQTAYLAVYVGLQQSLQTAVNTANTQVNSARDAALATYHQVQQQIASTFNSSTTSPMTMDDYMAQSAARQAAEAGAKREFLSTVASAELTAAQTVGQQYVSAVRSERGARATLMVALRHDENAWTETKAAAETALKDKTDVALARFMDDVTTLEGSYDTAAEQKFTTFESKVALAEQTAIVADQNAAAAFENALVADEELEIHADAAAEAAFEHALEDDAQAAEKAIALADQAWFNAEGDAEADWLHAETDASAAYVAALDAAALGLDTELSADETAELAAIDAVFTAWQGTVDDAWSTAFLAANGSSADSTAAAAAFIGFGDSVSASVAGVMTGFNTAYHALTGALIADVTAADQAEVAAVQTQTTAVATATKNAMHQIGQSLKDEETAEADAEHAASSTVSDAISGFITGETDAADAQTHTMIGAVTGYTNGLVTTAFGALVGDWSDQATRYGAVTGASVGFATSTIDASGNYETAIHGTDFDSLVATHRREEAQLKSILNAAKPLATAGAAARVADMLIIMRDDLQRLLALDNNQLGQFNPDQMTSVLAARMMIPTDFTSPTSAEQLTTPNNATPDQQAATEAARTLINQAANTAQGLRQSGVQTGGMQMMLGNATAYEDSAAQTIANEGTQLTQSRDEQFAKMRAKDEADAEVATPVMAAESAPVATDESDTEDASASGSQILLAGTNTTSLAFQLAMASLMASHEHHVFPREFKTVLEGLFKQADQKFSIDDFTTFVDKNIAHAATTDEVRKGLNKAGQTASKGGLWNSIQKLAIEEMKSLPPQQQRKVILETIFKTAKDLDFDLTDLTKYGSDVAENNAKSLASFLKLCADAGVDEKKYGKQMGVMVAKLLTTDVGRQMLKDIAPEIGERFVKGGIKSMLKNGAGTALKKSFGPLSGFVIAMAMQNGDVEAAMCDAANIPPEAIEELRALLKGKATFDFRVMGMTEVNAAGTLSVGQRAKITARGTDRVIGYVNVTKILDVGDGTYLVTITGEKGRFMQMEVSPALGNKMGLPDGFPYFEYATLPELHVPNPKTN